MHLPQQSRVLPLVSILVLLCTSCQRNAPRALAKSAVLEVYLLASSNSANSRAAVDPGTGAQIYLTLPPVITSADIATVQRAEDSSKQQSLIVKLTPPGAEKLSAATTPAVGQQVAFVVNGSVAAVAKVFSPLSNNFSISGGSISKDREEIFATLTEK
jgi:preprotein translocase subunit SecD